MCYSHKSIMADYYFEDKTSAKIVGSYTSYKGKDTTATRKLELLLDLQSKCYSAVTATSINEQISKTERIVDILNALAAMLQDNKYEKADDFVKEAENLVERVRVCADLSIKLHHSHTIGNKGPGQNPVAPNVAPVGAGAVTKPDQELRPPKLHNDTTIPTKLHFGVSF